MNRYEYRLQTINEAILILKEKEEYAEIIHALEQERQQILDDMRTME